MPTGTLLLIDDEARLRQLLARVLELEGYVVLQAPDAYRGLDLLAQHAAEVLVVLSDVKLPDGHGVELLPRYRAAGAAGRGGAAHGLRHHSRRGEGDETGRV
ncbi:MAG: response regulator [Hymenobacter sp.]